MGIITLGAVLFVLTVDHAGYTARLPRGNIKATHHTDGLESMSALKALSRASKVGLDYSSKMSKHIVSNVLWMCVFVFATPAPRHRLHRKRGIPEPGADNFVGEERGG